MREKANENVAVIHLSLLLVFFAVLIWSVISPFHLLFWLMQALPSFLIVLILVLTYQKFTFTTFVYVMVLLHMIVLLIGAHYTYSRNPLFDLLMRTFSLERNYYDRVGHFAQGFVPAFMIKEFLLRTGSVKKGRVLSLLVISACLGLSAFYELLELLAAFILGLPGEVVMGFQGDVWDSQWDMFMALIGASAAVIIFGALHDKYIARMQRQISRG